MGVGGQLRGERASGTSSVGYWVGLTAGLYDFEQIIEPGFPGCSARRAVKVPTTLCRLCNESEGKDERIDVSSHEGLTWRHPFNSLPRKDILGHGTLWFQASAVTWMISSLFRDVTQRGLVFTDVSGRPVGPTFKVETVHCCWIARHLTIGPIACPETSVTNYRCTLRNIPEERRADAVPCNRCITPWLPSVCDGCY